MEKKTIWQCHNPECNAQYGEYVNGCPKCSTGEPGGSHKVSIFNEHHPAYNKSREKKCNCHEPYDAEKSDGGYPRCPVHDVLQEKKYPIGGYAPGNYQCHCSTCGGGFIGDKRAVQCEPCAVAAKERFDKLDPNEQELLIKRNAMIANFMLSGPLTPERELIYRIVEQWGNAIEMPNMEGWLKEYAAKGSRTGPAWVKATTWPEDHNMVHWRRASDKKPLLIVGRNYQGNIVAQFGRVYTPEELEWLEEYTEK